jgi:MFS family permease
LADSAVASRPARSGWRRRYQQNRILFWICLTIFVNQLGFGSIVPVVPLYADTFGVSLTAIGLAVAVYGAARFLFNLPTARIADRWGRREALAIGGMLTVVGSLISATAPDYWMFLIGRFIAGGGASMVITGGQIVMTDITVPATRGRVMAIYQGVFMFAVGFGPIPGGLLAEHVGLAAPFYGHALLAAVVALIAWFRVPETRGMSGGVRMTAPVQQVALRGQFRLLMAQTGFVLIGIVSFCSFFARTGGIFNLIPNLGDEQLGLSPGQIGLGIGMISLMGLGLAYPSGWLVDRYGRKTVIVPSTLIAGLSMILFALAPNYGWFLAASLVWAVSAGISGAAPNAYAADMAPSGMNASAMGLYRMIADTGYIAGPLLLGLSADLLSTTTALYFTAALVFASGLAFALFAPETYSAREVRRATAGDD